MASKLPWFKFFPTDFLGDQTITQLPLEAQGLWLRLVCVMRSAARRGYLQDANGSPLPTSSLAKFAGSTAEETDRLLHVLVSSGAFDRTKEGVIFCRRIVREEKTRQARSKAGKKGMMSRYGDDTVNNAVCYNKPFCNNNGYNGTLASGKEDLIGERGERKETDGSAAAPVCADLSAADLANKFIFMGGKLRSSCESSYVEASKEFAELLRLGYAGKHLDADLENKDRFKREYIHKLTDRITKEPPPRKKTDSDAAYRKQQAEYDTYLKAADDRIAKEKETQNAPVEATQRAAS